MENNSGIDETKIVAWWGAILATFVFLWDIYKWKKSGPNIELEVSPSRMIMNDPRYEGKTFISVTAKNNGTQATTITNLRILFYTNIFSRVINKPNKAAVITGPGYAYPLPHIIEPGTVWDGLITQDTEVVKMAKQGYLMCALDVSNSKKPVKKRISRKYIDIAESTNT